MTVPQMRNVTLYQEVDSQRRNASLFVDQAIVPEEQTVVQGITEKLALVDTH
jgi:hypothetical protein